MPVRNTHERRPVLLIVPDAALRRVMAVGLRRRGLRVLEAHALGAAWDLVAAPPAAIVLDIGLGVNSEWTLLHTVRRHRVLGQAPLVVLAWECPVPAAPSAPLPVCLAKPFDARVLYAAVDDLVRTPALSTTSATPGSTLGSTLAEPKRLRYASAQSLWPLATAAGATLALTGLLINVALVVIGVTLLLAAVLLWTGEVGEAPEPATPVSPASSSF